MAALKKILPFIITILVSLVLVAPHLSFSVTDSANMLNVSVSVYELGDSSIAARTNLDTGETVKVYSKYGLGLPLLMQPFLALNDIAHFVYPGVKTVTVLTLPNVLILALTAECVFLILSAMGFGFSTGLFISLLTVFGTFAYPYMNYFLSEPLQGLLITLAFLFIYRAGYSKEQERYLASSFLCGVALSLAALTKAAIIVLFPPFFIYAIFSVKDGWRTKGLKSAASFLIPVVIFGLTTAYLNHARFGSIFDFGYGKEAGMFTNPIGSGLADFLYNPGKSVFIFAPAALLFPYALWRFGKRFRDEALLIGALFTVNLVFYSAWWAWEGGDSWGPRFLLPLIPLAMIPLSEVIQDRVFRAITVVLFAAGFLVNLLPVLQDPMGYNYLVLKSTAGMEVETPRPPRDYLDMGTFRQVPPHVVTSTIPEFNVISGHLWALRARRHGRRTGAGISSANKVFYSPPWLEKYPERTPPPIDRLPKEIKIRLGCPTPAALSYILCPDESPSAPYYFDALMMQADKARALGLVAEANMLRVKALRDFKEKDKRVKQMSAR